MQHPLFNVVRHIQEGSVRTAYRLLHSLSYDKTVHAKEYVFANALKHKLNYDYVENQNLYLNEFEDDADTQIDLFKLLAKVPHFTLSYNIGNGLISQCLSEANQDDIAYMDLGLGQGRQTIEILRLVAASDKVPEKITVIGLEPDSVSLHAAQTAITQFAENMLFEIEFVGINKCAEAISEDEWRALRKQYGGRIVIGAAYSLHHIVSQPNDVDKRDGVLHQLYQLNPIKLVLLEGNANINTDDFFARFKSCWALYGSCFDIVDALHELNEEEKTALKVGFFGREIEDILAKDQTENRHERMETLAIWANRIVNAGFSLDKEMHHCMPEVAHPLVNLAHYEGYVDMKFNDSAIVGVLSAKVA